MRTGSIPSNLPSYYTRYTSSNYSIEIPKNNTLAYHFMSDLTSKVENYWIKPNKDGIADVFCNGKELPYGKAKNAIRRAIEYCLENNFFPAKLLNGFSQEEFNKYLRRIK